MVLPMEEMVDKIWYDFVLPLKDRVMNIQEAQLEQGLTMLHSIML